MLNEPIDGGTIYSAIVKTLKPSFPDTAVYKDAVTTTLKYPHFFVYIVDTRIDKVSYKYYKLTHTINIKYRYDADPSVITGIKEKLALIGFKLADTLEKLIFKEETTTSPQQILWTRDNQYSVIEDVLEYFFDIDILLSREQMIVYMNSLQTNITLEGE